MKMVVKVPMAAVGGRKPARRWTRHARRAGRRTNVARTMKERPAVQRASESERQWRPGRRRRAMGSSATRQQRVKMPANMKEVSVSESARAAGGRGVARGVCVCGGEGSLVCWFAGVGAYR